jgi:hypothetical protein
MVLLWQGKKNLIVCQIFRGSRTEKITTGFYIGLELYKHGKRSLKIAFFNIGYSLAQGILFAIQNKFEFSTAKKPRSLQCKSDTSCQIQPSIGYNTSIS